MNSPRRSEALQNPHLDGSPFFFPGGPIGVVLSHGMLASPVEMSLIAHALHAKGLTVAGPRLPGHGTQVLDLKKVVWQAWLAEVLRTVDDLLQRCEQVFVGGESLGALLTLLAAVERPAVRGIIAYAPAMRIRSPLAQVTPLLRYFLPVVEKKRAQDPDEAIVDTRWHGYPQDSPPAVAQLLQVQKAVRRRLSAIRQPLLILQGKKDKTLDLRGAEELYNGIASPNKELIWLPNSTHCLALDREWEQVAALTYSFIEQIAQLKA